jgi:phenylacetic acid degradation operon negative regulatory protein
MRETGQADTDEADGIEGADGVGGTDGADGTDGAAPTVLRRHAAGTESARSLLFTVLGELVLPTGGQAWTSAFIDVLGRLGVEEKAARQALMRTAADNWLSSERVGRRTVWRLTPASERLLRDGTERIFGFRAVAEDWDGRWTLVIARTPETERATRHLLRTRLRWAGFGAIMPGVWLSPRGDRAAEVREILAAAGLPDGYLFAAEYQGGGPVTALVGQAWDLDELARGYDDFIVTFGGPAGSDPLARVIDLVHAWRRFPWIDPGLPAAFLPAPWSGSEAAGLFARRHAEWAGEAISEWRQLLARM